MRLEELHVACVVLLDGLKHMAHGSVKYLVQRWAQVGQVDLIWTNVGPKWLCLGCTIEVKVNGGIKLEERTDMARICMHLKGEIDLNRGLAVIWFPYNFIWNWLAPL